jgi:hypothetical protein
MNSTPSSTVPVEAGRVPARFWAIAVLWLAAVVAAERTGALAELGHRFMPGYAILVALGIALPTLAYFGFARVRHAVDGIGLHALTLMHAWRIPAALLFFYHGLQDHLPALFWILAGVGDLLAGACALTAAGRRRSDEHYRRIHRFGFADFVVAVGTGLTFTLLGDPKMELLTTLPMALIPLFGVGLSGASHIIALYTLDRRAMSD